MIAISRSKKNEEAYKDLVTYFDKGNLNRILYSIDDINLSNKVREINRSYLVSLSIATFYIWRGESCGFSHQEVAEAEKIVSTNIIKIADIQKLINDKLEAL